MKRLPDELIDKNKHLIYSIAIKFRKVCELEDAFQAGVIGLIKAYNNYDINSGSEFSSYAYMYIYGEILSTIKSNRNIKVSSEYIKVYKAYEKTRDYLSSKLFKEPSLDEISSFMNIDSGYLGNVIEACSFTVSTSDNLNDNGFSLEDVLGEDNTDNIDRLIDLRRAIEKLTSDERKLITLRYFKDYTQSETARILDISQVQVSRYESAILRKIREYN